MNPDTCGRDDSMRIRICVDAETSKSTDSKVSGYVWMGPRKRRVAHAYNIKLPSGEVWRIIDQFDILKFSLKRKTSAHRQPLWYACCYKEALETS